MAEQVLKVNLDSNMTAALSEHNIKLFLSGVVSDGEDATGAGEQS
jgi:hypothetical protein